MINKLEEFTQWAGLEFNPQKCIALSAINATSQKYVESFSPKVNGVPIPALKQEDRYKYLGVQTGWTTNQSLPSLKEEMVEDATKICKSLLSDWQKIEKYGVKVLTDHEWKSFEEDVRQWTTDLQTIWSHAKRKKATHHPTTNWKRRQRKRNQHNRDSQQSSENGQQDPETSNQQDESGLLNTSPPSLYLLCLQTFGNGLAYIY